MASAAATTVVLPHRILTTTTTNVARCSILPYLPPRISSFSPSLKHFQESRKSSLLQIRAYSDETSTSPDPNELITDLKEKWDAVENKSTLVLYGGGAIVFVWLTSIVLGAINSVPLLPKILELVGLGYTGWFVYRYLLYKSSRKELATDIEALKKKIAGTE
ncbi:putative cyanobacterial aminoacyl-tRNA synthetase, CAAD domain, protein CURVATURE THYLAKOID 1 [Lupinus albus]|uniref:Putative cyanobacterial aminoacyl-tRNA synthetase, CAAD domain, protein CURVATURE THYLAKOID 1 n=1 Tax=Lupinus albus TaxID=3870 RepID=A0A6A4PW32_LUPAL|nr:putative cyanobacterial aminoacyl-tRNA synthetase, CAAD domain, protein CURVATURE THYLAKOID 1 [Lupinus albus]